MVHQDRIQKVYQPLRRIRQKCRKRKRLTLDEHYVFLEIALAIIFDGMNAKNCRNKQIMAAIFVVSFLSKFRELGEVSATALSRKIELQEVIITRKEVFLSWGKGSKRGTIRIECGGWQSHMFIARTRAIPRHLIRATWKR